MALNSRLERERQDVARYLPGNTTLTPINGRDVWIFQKNTNFGIEFEIALYYDPDERGYCAQLVKPEIESEWKSAHVGHIFSDGVICFGGNNIRARPSLREAFAKSCLWAEGIGAMIAARDSGNKIPFPFSINNSPGDVS